MLKQKWFGKYRCDRCGRAFDMNPHFPVHSGEEHNGFKPCFGKVVRWERRNGDDRDELHRAMAEIQLVQRRLEEERDMHRAIESKTKDLEYSHACALDIIDSLVNDSADEGSKASAIAKARLFIERSKERFAERFS